MGKVKIDNIKYNDFKDKNKYYGLVYTYVENIKNHYKVISDETKSLKLRLKQPNVDKYSNYHIFLFKSIQEMQEYIDKLCKDYDTLYAECYYDKNICDNENDFDYVKDNYKNISQFFVVDKNWTKLYIKPNIDYNKYFIEIYKEFFEPNFKYLINEITNLLIYPNFGDEEWERYLKKTQEKYNNIMIKFNNVYIDNIYINMYEQSIDEGYTMVYNSLLELHNKLDIKLNSLKK